VEGAGDQAAAFGAVDQAGDAGFVQAQVPGQLGHGGGAVPQDAEQAGLGDRQVVLGGPALEDGVDREGELG
jgi:hypothetical protein